METSTKPCIVCGCFHDNSACPKTGINRCAVLSYFSGKSLEKARVAMDSLEASLAQGFWAPGVSRSVRAVLGKANLARRTSKRLRDVLESLWDQSKDKSVDGWEIAHCMSYGLYGRLGAIDLTKIRALVGVNVCKRFSHPPLVVCTAADQDAALDEVAPWVKTFIPLGAAMARLDSTRPKPVFTEIGVSPTLTRTLEDAGLDGEGPASISVCPMEWKLVDRADAKGVIRKVWVGRLLWPAGTQHDTSRHAGNASTGWGHSKCHACGHAIRNPFNWVPLVLRCRDGVIRSLWTGRDCAESLFGIKMTGELELAEARGTEV